jgi:hypothetical protein
MDELRRIQGAGATVRPRTDWAPGASLTTQGDLGIAVVPRGDRVLTVLVRHLPAEAVPTAVERIVGGALPRVP